MLKKTEEFKAAKGATAGTKTDSVSWLKKKRPATDDSISQPKQLKAVEEDSWEKSRRKLEEKALLYEKMVLGDEEGVSEDVRENILIDFDRKFVALRDAGQLPIPEEASEEEMVEFVDEFGRTRTMSKAEYEQILNTQSTSEPECGPDRRTSEPEHFDDTKEIRSRGVGFYRFSKEEEERQRQMRELTELRQNTVETRTKNAILMEQRRLMKEARLEKVKERRSKK